MASRNNSKMSGNRKSVPGSGRKSTGNVSQSGDRDPNHSKLYSISVSRFLGRPTDQTVYTHGCCNQNWLPPPGIPPFCFQQKTLSLFLNKDGDDSPKSYYAPKAKDDGNSDDDDDDNHKRKVFCRFQNPGMPSRPVCLECCQVGEEPKKSTKSSVASKDKGVKEPPKRTPTSKSPFYNNCNFYNIDCRPSNQENAAEKKKSMARPVAGRSSYGSRSGYGSGYHPYGS